MHWSRESVDISRNESTIMVQRNMKLPIVLCFVVGANAAVLNSTFSGSEVPSQQYDTIVIGLGSAGVTAATTLARAGRRVLGLEAQGRVGGRVNTVPFGDGVVEMGAEWIHGTVNSRVYNLALDNNIGVKNQSVHIGFFRSDAGTVDQALVSQLMEFYMEHVGIANETEPLGRVMTRTITAYIRQQKPELLGDQAFVSELLDLFNRESNSQEGSSDWDEVASVSRYRDLGGSLAASWHRNGYKTFFDIMLNKYNNGPGLPNLDIKLDTEVTSITAPRLAHEKVVVRCKDGRVYEADTAIVSVSLGVLKATHRSLFSRPLPENKQTAIDKISMGVLDKIILSFEQPWWPQEFSVAAFIWKGEDKKIVGQADHWTTRIFGSSRPMGSSNTLTLWTSGNVAKEVESLPEEVVKRKSIDLLQRFIGNTLNITVPQPIGMLRSSWYTNPFTRGSYTFDSVAASQYPDARDWLRTALADSDGGERVLFAGEATNVEHYGTVHGASETGYRAAMKILNTL